MLELAPALVVRAVIDEATADLEVMGMVGGAVLYGRPKVEDRPQASQPWQWGDCPTRHLRATPHTAASAYERPNPRVRSPGTRLGGRRDRLPRIRPALSDRAAWWTLGDSDESLGILMHPEEPSGT